MARSDRILLAAMCKIEFDLVHKAPHICPAEDEEFAITGSRIRASSCTMYIHKNIRWGWSQFFAKRTVSRTVLSITEITPVPRMLVPYKDGDQITRWRQTAATYLKCQLYLRDQALYEITQNFLEAVAARRGYDHVEYVDMADSSDAWYSDGSRPPFPEMRALNV